MSDSLKEALSNTPRFFETVKSRFSFLEAAYGYQWQQENIESPHDYRDTTAFVNYLGAKIGVQILWYFSTGIIDVIFVELQQPGIFPEKSMLYKDVFWEGKRDISRGVRLSTLVAMLGYNGDPAFLLSDYNNVMESKCKKRIGIISTNLRGVIEGLGDATQKYALDILKGDTTIFSEVIQYYTAIRLR